MEKGIGPVMTVMQPRVVNESNVPRGVPLENVSLDGLLCRYGNPEKYKDCIEYNTTFCHNECEFGPKKELPLPDVNLDYQREDGK